MLSSRVGYTGAQNMARLYVRDRLRAKHVHRRAAPDTSVLTGGAREVVYAPCATTGSGTLADAHRGAAARRLARACRKAVLAEAGKADAVMLLRLHVVPREEYHQDFRAEEKDFPRAKAGRLGPARQAQCLHRATLMAMMMKQRLN